MYPQVFGKYVLERELARGGMARVMLATLRGAGGFEKKLVVKQIRDELACDDEFVRRFVEEAKTAVALAHPNIVPVYELGVELGTYFLSMELVDGASLSELLRGASPEGLLRQSLSPEEGAYIGVEVCRALDYAHRRMNVVHRDVTPRNVMVDEEGQVKVIDFGIAAPVATGGTGQGVFGSPGHMPPEQMAGADLTPAADVFATAVLLMEVWSGRPVFRRQTNEEVETAMRAPHPKPSDANIRLLPVNDVILSALSLDPKARPQQADDLARVLRRFLAGVDLGDLARQLGDRVRAIRANPPAAIELKAILGRPASRPTGTQVGTKTFAVREEVRSLSTATPDVATRRMASKAPGGTKDRKRLAAHSVAWAAALAATAVSATAFVVGRGAAPTETGTLRGGDEEHLSVVPTRSDRADGGEREDAQRSEGAGPRDASKPAPPPTAFPAASSTSPPLSVTAERAQLVLFGDGTSVRVDGVSHGRCPTRASLEPGVHSVLFTFPATGESKGESVRLRAGERVTIRADFTAATPTVRTDRR